MLTIHLNITDIDDLFDHYDAAPLLQRHFNNDWLAYLLKVMDEHPRERHWNLVLQISSAVLSNYSSNQILLTIKQQLVRQHKLYAYQLRRHFRMGRIALVIGLLVLSGLLSLSIVIGQVVHHPDWQQALQEGCVIIGWVALWRPAEILLYDWWPLKHQQRKLKRILAGNITIMQ